MAITLAKQDGTLVRVYNGSQNIWSRSGKLHGYTAGSVNIQDGSVIRTYDEKQSCIATTSA